MSSVRELEARGAVERKKLIQTVSRYLLDAGIQTRIIQEPGLDSFGISVLESAIQLKDQRIDTIRLFRMSGSGCGSSDVLRFQYQLRLEKEIPKEDLSKVRARTQTVKTGKVLGLFGGKIVGVKWLGQELAEVLNQDSEISDGLLRCVQIWGEMEFNIDAVTLSEINISGPWFVNPDTIIALYSPGKVYEEQNCVFGYKTADRIAGLIQEKILNIEFIKQGEKNVTN